MRALGFIPHPTPHTPHPTPHTPHPTSLAKILFASPLRDKISTSRLPKSISFVK
ncbi:MAG: hypothetical protein ACK47N_02995 [Microcystis sp.]|uniref:hypothetical protein n=1 Tax=Microcystis TaxID=1125 RepID=UPI002245079A|nr:hypothetical protein [Microcystis aeruginosa]UZO76811.1 hypothetical protein M8120_01735 [Microcystis aeruginosa str. Chao 1910]